MLSITLDSLLRQTTSQSLWLKWPSLPTVRPGCIGEQLLTQQKCPRHREQVMWLQPPFFWMGAPQPVQGLVFLVSHDSL